MTEALYAENCANRKRAVGSEPAMSWITGELTSCRPRGRAFKNHLLSEFTPRCVAALEQAYSSALSPSPPTLRSVLMKWTSRMLLTGSVDEILSAASNVCFNRYSELGP